MAEKEWYGHPLPHIILGFEKGRREKRQERLAEELLRMQAEKDLAKAKAKKEKPVREFDYMKGLGWVLSLKPGSDRDTAIKDFKDRYGIDYSAYRDVAEMPDVTKGAETYIEIGPRGVRRSIKEMPEVKVEDVEAATALKKARTALTEISKDVTRKKVDLAREMMALRTAAEKRHAIKAHISYLDRQLDVVDALKFYGDIPAEVSQTKRDILADIKEYQRELDALGVGERVPPRKVAPPKKVAPKSGFERLRERMEQWKGGK